MNLLLQRREFGQVAEQANRAGDFVGVVLDRGNGHAELAQFVRRRQVFDFLAAECAAVFQASRDKVREARPASKHFAVAAVGEGFHAECGFGRGIGAGDQAGGIHQQQAGGHVARDRFAHALGLLRALALGAVQGFEFLFLFLELFDDGLHGRRHERRGVVAAGLVHARIFRRLRSAAEITPRAG